jgi:hypothetical protein
MRRWLLLLCLAHSLFHASAQENRGSSVSQSTASDLDSISMQGYASKYAKAVNNKTKKLQEKIEKKIKNNLEKFKEAELALIDKVAIKDSALANQLLQETLDKYKALEDKLTSISGLNISNLGSIDSSSAILQFFGSLPAIEGTKIGSKVDEAILILTKAGSSLKKSDLINEFLRRQRSEWQQRLSSIGMIENIKGINKQVYYFGQQIHEYKTLLSDPAKLERKIAALLCKIPAFNKFLSQTMTANSLFPGASPLTPLSSGISPAISLGNVSSYSGLQPRTQVQQAITQRTGISNSSSQQLQQFITTAGQQYNELRTKLDQEKAEETIGFKVNSQKVKSFKKRLEYGADIQFEKSTTFFPGRANLGLRVGYKLTDKSIIGLGISYKAGLGTGWKNIQFSHQGIGIRSYAEFSIKNNFYGRFGAELNYINPFNSINNLSHVQNWQRSALLGITKRIRLKGGKSGSLQFMYDFLYKTHYPISQPFIYRIGYNF